MESLEHILNWILPCRGLSNEEKLRLANQKNEHYLELIDLINPDYILPGIEESIEKN